MRFSGLLRQTWAGLRILLVLTVLTGIVYPLAVWGVSRVPGLHDRAEGSVVRLEGRPAGSSLIGLNPVDPNAKTDPRNDRYFHTRPSATAADFATGDHLGLADNDGNTSGASNLSADSDTLAKQITDRRHAIATREGVNLAAVPADAVTASASGLDPDISPAYAYLQAARVARVTGLSVEQVHQIVAEHVRGRAAGLLGDPTVNVGELNLAVIAARR